MSDKGALDSDALRALAQQEIDGLYPQPDGPDGGRWMKRRFEAIDRVGEATGWDRDLYWFAAKEALDGIKPSGIRLKAFLIDLSTWPEKEDPFGIPPELSGADASPRRFRRRDLQTRSVSSRPRIPTCRLTSRRCRPWMHSLGTCHLR